MDVIREHLMYKNEPLMICLAKLTPQEQYECMRILLESKTPVSICSHDASNTWINLILKELPVKFVQCWVPEVVQTQVPERVPEKVVQ